MRATNSLEPLYQGPLLLLVEAEGAVERFALTNQFIQVGKGSESYAEHARRLYRRVGAVPIILLRYQGKRWPR